ncbi:hypothetical protein G9A89_017263 [Geosiphon pyriformis]|nr:hypothetical protein G9A89_017263 [Geosiphon pyriformis]
MILICDWVRGGTPFKAAFNRAVRRLQYYPHDEDKLYNIAQTKVRGRTAEEIQHWKESAKVANKVISYNMFDPQEQYLAQINIYLCKNCLILCQNQCCEECQDKKNLEKKMEIEYQQFQNQSINQQNSSDRIIPERVHPTNAEFNLHYLEDQSTMLPPRSITKINLKIVVEIPPGIMVQIAFIQGRVINSGYTGNLMVLLQNNSEKSYTIESKEKIAQAIFLPLVKIGKFMPVENHEELIQTTRRTFGFGSTGKGIEANFTETIEEKGELIKTEQSIMLMPYRKSEIKIKRTIKDINLIFEPHPETCQQFSIGLINFFILANKTQ